MSLRSVTARPAANAIGVRGDWRITVRNRDGSVAARRRFHNELTERGRDLLSRIFRGEDTFGWWGIRLTNGGRGPGLACGTSQGCSLYGVRGASPLQPRLQVTQTRSGVLQLRGTTLGVRAGTHIGEVQTSIKTCRADVDPDACAQLNGGGAQFTQVNFGAAGDIPVAVDQTIQITVTISFVNAPQPPS